MANSQPRSVLLLSGRGPESEHLCFILFIFLLLFEIVSIPIWSAAATKERGHLREKQCD